MFFEESKEDVECGEEDDDDGGDGEVFGREDVKAIDANEEEQESQGRDDREGLGDDIENLFGFGKFW